MTEKPSVSSSADPYLDQGMRGWLFKTAKANYRGIAGCGLDDLIQEGYLCYYKCRARYVGKPPETKKNGTCRYLPETDPDGPARRHFMSLVQRAFSNRISDMRKKQSALVEVPACQLIGADQTEEQMWETVIPADYEVASASMLLASAPTEIKQLFKLLIDDMMEIKDSMWFWQEEPNKVPLSGYRRFGRRRRAPRETTNQRFCRLLGLKPGTDIVGEVDRHFLGA